MRSHDEREMGLYSYNEVINRIDHTKRAEESFLRNQTQKRERKQEPFKEEEDDDGIYCYCQRPSEGNMIFCDYPKVCYSPNYLSNKFF